MMKKIVSWLTFMAVFLLTLQSCVHDEIYSSSDPVSKVYHSKSLWKEDEKYIKNVKQIFEGYADRQYFSSSFGTVYWDYATTMGTYDEKFLEVPVIKNSKVNFILLVYRDGDRIFFKRKDDENSKRFFQILVFTDREKNKVSGRIPGSEGNVSKSFCYTVETTVTWTNEDGTPGPTYSSSEMHCVNTGPTLPCQALDTESNCGGTSGTTGSGNSGSGSTGYPYLHSQNQDIITTDLQGYPCAQNIAQQLPNLQNDLGAAMRQIFQNNEKYNITFRPRSNMGNVDGLTFTSHTNTGSFTAIISLNDQILTNATKEYILVTMYHEVIHAFLDYEKFRLGDIAFQDQYPGIIVGYDYTSDGTVVNRYTYIDGHQQLIPFLTTLQNILSAYNPNLPHDVIVAMARTGITTTTQVQYQLNSNEKNTTLGNHKGTKCP